MVAAIVLGLGILAFARGWFGGGDVKMLAAVSLWAGPAHLSLLLLVTALAGGLLSLIILCRPLLQRLAAGPDAAVATRAVEHTSELQSLMRISYAVFCLTKNKQDDHNIKN